MKYRNLSWLTGCVVVLVLAAANSINAEIPKRSKEKLRESSSHALTGKVARTYERQEKKSGFVYTYGVAELSVEHVDKGSEIAANDRVFVRYWRKKWTGRGNPPPDHYGHWNIPEKSDSVLVYVKGDRKAGFDVLSPNGFFKLTKDKPD